MKKQKKYFNLETYDYTPYARELTEEEMYLVNGGRVVKGSARETEVVPSRPSSSSESGNSSGTSATSNSSPAPAATQTTTGSSQTYSSSQQSNTESQTSSAPTCTAAQIAAAKGAAANAYFAEQDKKREENNKQQNSSGSSSSSSSSQSSETQHNTNDQYIMAQKDYDEHYGNYTSETATDNSTTYTNSVTSSTSHKDEPVPGQNLSGTAMEDQLGGNNPFGNRKNALTPAEQAEMARQDAEIHNNLMLKTIEGKEIIINSIFYQNAPLFTITDGVGASTATIKLNCYTSDEGQLNVSASGSYNGKNKIAVDSYFFSGNVTLLVNDVEKEHKQLKYPDYPFWSDGNYDYIGSASFDTKFNYSDKVDIVSDIDLVINKTNAYIGPKKYSLR